MKLPNEIKIRAFASIYEIMGGGTFFHEFRLMEDIFVYPGGIMKRLVLCSSIFITLLLAGMCSCSVENKPIPSSLPLQETAAQPEAVEETQSSSGDTLGYKDFWDARGKEFGQEAYYFDRYGLAEELGSKAGPILLEGLQCENPVVRWYCAYKVTEYLDTVDAGQLRSLLEPMSRDEKEFVANAAGFALAVVEKDFDQPGFIKSGNGKRIAFQRFAEARYNDGKVLIIENGKVSVIYDDINASAVSWSPDDRWLVVTGMGRIWIDTFLVNVDTKEVVSPRLFPYIHENAKNYDLITGEHQRPDPYEQFVEWSPDSKKVLLSLSFTDDRYARQRCLAVYDLGKHKVDWLMKLTPAEGDHPDFDKPQGFSWDQADYGVRSGRLENFTALRKKSDPAFRKLVDGINKGDVKAVREFTDAGLPDRFTDEALLAAMEDYREYFRGQGIVRFEFVGVSPFTENSVTYRAFNGDGRFKDMELVLREGKYICIDNFLSIH
jgi:hypothetical protein